MPGTLLSPTERMRYLHLPPVQTATQTRSDTQAPSSVGKYLGCVLLNNASKALSTILRPERYLVRIFTEGDAQSGAHHP